MTSHHDVAVVVAPKPEFVEWLHELAAKGGKGVVNNIDARCLGRVATLLESQAKALSEAERERDRALMKLLAAVFDGNAFEARAIAAESRLAEAIKHIESADLWTDENYDVGDWREAARAFTNAAKEKTDAVG